ncbi:MAG: helix-turn-helix transcriptional regulator [Pseudomonadota bacterium]
MDRIVALVLERTHGPPMEDRIKAKLGERILAVREASGLTQEEFAARAGYDRNFWGRLERGAQNPTLTTLVRIAGALDLTVSELLVGVDR